MATNPRQELVKKLFGEVENDSPALVLAPMVRAGTLPLRLLALYYGAQTTWSEELIAKKLLKCTRVENTKLGTIDFVLPSQGGASTLVYQTCAYEKGRNIVQIGAGNAQDAVLAARVVKKDIAGIDLNCGCPQHFSLSGGMGAYLLSKPCITSEIIRALRQEVGEDVTVSCKIRLHETAEETIKFIKHLESAGVDAITIHARRIPERSRDKARWDELENIIKSASVPVVVNGDVFTKEDMGNILKFAPSASGVMVARGAVADVSAAFSNERMDIIQTISDYLDVASVLCTPNFPNTKWFVSQIIRYRKDDSQLPSQRKVLNENCCRAKSFDEMRLVFNATSAEVSDFSVWWSRIDKSAPQVWNEAITRLLKRTTTIPINDKEDNVHNKRPRLEIT